MTSRNNYNLHGRKDFLKETVRIAVKYGIRHEVLGACDIRQRFHQFMLTGDEEGYYEYEAGLLRPDNCVNANLRMALQNNGNIDVKTGEEVLGIKPIGNDKVVVFAGSRIYEAGQVILTVGPWIKHLLNKRYHNLFKVHRQVMYWFHPRESITPYEVGNFPIFIWQFEDGFIYGFPAIGGRDGGVKVASEQTAVQTDPDLVDRDVSDEEIRTMHKKFIANRLPGLSSSCARAVTCLYTVTPDSNFIIDRHPEFPQVIVASPCSGHGFKHSAAVGQILAELAIEDKSSFDISSFSFIRS